MKRRYKVAGGILLGLGVLVVCLALVLSHTEACSPAPAADIDDGSTPMRAIQYRCYGSPDVLELVDVARPVPQADEVLVRVKAASVNPLDWHYMRGSPFIMRLDAGLGAPDVTRLGVDFAGVVEAVADGVTNFKPGDEVFGGRTGAFAEYVTKNVHGSLALKPANVSFAQAASVHIAGITALQALRDHGRLQPGQHVLINGASGGVGTFAVQIAKVLGATVTAVCSERNAAMVRSLGADHVIDYRQSNYTSGEQRYDLIVDMIGNHSVSANLDALTADGRLVIVGGEKGDWIGPLANMIKGPLLSPFVDQEIIVMLARATRSDLDYLAGLMQSGALVPVIDRVFALADTPEAIAYLEQGHASGKVIIEID